VSDLYRGDEAEARALHKKGGELSPSPGQPIRATPHAHCALSRASRITFMGLQLIELKLQRHIFGTIGTVVV